MRPKQETSCRADRSVIVPLRSRGAYTLRNVLPGDGRVSWQRLAVSARVAVRLAISGCVNYVVREAKTQKKHI